MKNKTISVNNSIFPGCVLSSILSYSVNQSAIWAIVHMFCGWFYTIYWCCTYSRIPEMILEKVGA